MTGLPGVGKTALARVAALRIAETLGATAVEISLRTASGESDRVQAAPDLVMQEIAAARERSGTVIGEGPLVLLLDDVVERDEAEAVVAGVDVGSVVVLTSRNVDALPDSADPLRLDPLHLDDAVALLRDRLGAHEPAGRESPSDLAEVARLTGRLPLAVEILAGQMRSREGWTVEDHVRRIENQRGDLLATLEDAYRALDGDARHVLRIAASLPARLDVAELSPLASSPDAVEPSLQRLLAAHHLTRGRDGRFDLHDVVRAVALDRLIDEEPHSGLRAGVTRLAEHLLATFDDLPSPWVEEHADVLVGTAQRAADLGLAELVTTLASRSARQLRLASHDLDSLLITDLARWQGDPGWRHDAEREYATSLMFLGRTSEATRIAEHLVATSGIDVLVPDLTLLGNLRRLGGREEESLEMLLQAHAQAVRQDLPDSERGRVTVMLVTALVQAGRGEQVRHWAGVGLAEIGDSDPHTRLMLEHHLAFAEYLLDDLDAADTHLARVRQTARDLGRGDVVHYSGMFEVEVLLARGEGERAREAALRLTEEFVAAGSPPSSQRVHLVAAQALLAVGEVEAAGVELDRYVRLEHSTTGGDVSGLIAPDLGDLALARGDLAAAEEWYRRAVAPEHLSCTRCRARSRIGAGDVALARGDVTVARAAWLEGLEPEVEAPPVLARQLRERLERHPG